MAKIGDIAVCINQELWGDSITKKSAKGPKFKQQLVITKISENGYLGFDEFPEDNYTIRGFVIIEKQTESVSIKLETKKVLERETIIAN